MVANKRWRVTVSKLGEAEAERALEVDAANWVMALRAARRSLGEEGDVPHGASCAVDPDGVVTVLVPASRRRFIVTQAHLPRRSGDRAQPKTRGQARSRGFPLRKPRRVARTISYDAMLPPPFEASGYAANRPSSALGSTGDNDGSRHSSADLKHASRPPAGTFQVNASAVAPEAGPAGGRVSSAAYGASVAQASVAPSHAVSERPQTPPTSIRPRALLQLILERNENPGVDNPLLYRERAYAIAPGVTLEEAEVALQEALQTLRDELADEPAGKFVNLAIFDHRWLDTPRRPPLIVLEWRDWRGEPTLQYLTNDFEPDANELDEQEQEAESDAERLAALFEDLKDLPHANSAADALNVALELLNLAIPCDACAACLYDINTDELRFVAVRGHGAERQQSTATPARQGLLGHVARNGDGALRYPQPQQQAPFSPTVDGRPGLTVKNLLLRPLRAEGRLLGMLQLINRSTPSDDNFTPGDLNLANYVGDRLSHTLKHLL